jgi:hypothetical protein
MKHQALKVMTNRRLNLSQERIGHGTGEVTVGHRPNPGNSDGVCPPETVDELVLGVVSGLGGRRRRRSVALEQDPKLIVRRLNCEQGQKVGVCQEEVPKEPCRVSLVGCHLHLHRLRGNIGNKRQGMLSSSV